jgi:hypothetical protein
MKESERILYNLDFLRSLKELYGAKIDSVKGYSLGGVSSLAQE